MTYDILLQPLPQGQYQATVLGWPELRVVGESEADVLKQIKESLQLQLAQSKIVRLEIENLFNQPTTTQKSEHPWMQFAGMFADDEDWDEYLECLAEIRRELNQIEAL